MPLTLQGVVRQTFDILFPSVNVLSQVLVFGILVPSVTTLRVRFWFTDSWVPSPVTPPTVTTFRIPNLDLCDLKTVGSRPLLLTGPRLPVHLKHKETEK